MFSLTRYQGMKLGGIRIFQVSPSVRTVFF